MKQIMYSTFDDYTSDKRGGTAISVHNIAKRLKENYNVTVLVAKHDCSPDSIIDGVVYKHIGVSFGDLRFRQLVYLFLLPWHVTFTKFDVWIEAFTGPISTAFLPFFTRKPVIGVTHFFNGDEMRKKYKIRFDIIEKIGIKQFKNIVVLTDFQKEKALLMNQKLNLRVIPNGVDENFFSLEKNKDASELLYMGRIDIHTKGLDILLMAIANLCVDKLNTQKLIIGGKGTVGDEADLHNRIQQLNLEDKVIVRGYLAGEGKYTHLKNCVVFIAPSRFENFGGSILQAMASALPVVIFDLPCHSWIPTDCAVRVPAFDVKKYSEAIQYLLDYPEEREMMSARAREFARSFSWDQAVQKYADFIEEVTD